MLRAMVRSASSLLRDQSDSRPVTSSGKPTEIDLKTMYKFKGLGTEHTIVSKVKIFTEGERITKDRRLME
jgi:hypothetical protein